MKKLYSVVLALVLALALPFSAFAYETADVAGDWYGSMYGINLVLTLNEDGTYKMSMPGFDDEEEDEAEVSTWKLEGDQVIMGAEEDGEDAGSLAIGDGTLTLSEDGMEVVFTREPVDTFTPAEPKTDATEEEYAGAWKSGYVSTFGMTVDGESLGLDMIAVVEGTTVTLKSAGMSMDDSMELTYQDGSMFLDLMAQLAATEETEEAAEDETAAEEDEGTISVALQKLQDDTMSLTMSMYGTEVIFYMNPITEEELAAAEAAMTEAAAAESVAEDVVEEVEEAETSAE